MTSPAMPRPKGLRRLRVAAAFALVATIGFLAMLLGAAWKLPAAAGPALIGAAIGAVRIFRARDKGAVHWSQAFDYDRATKRVLLLSVGFGAVGYMILAAFGVGVPDPTVSLPWRAFGGFSVGAVAGVLAYFVISTMHIVVMIVQMWRHLLTRAEVSSDSNPVRGSQ